MERVEKIDKGSQPVIIVSGLPRSGTSMMMQMLSAGGVEILTDKKRNADESNPKGYFEYEQVKTLEHNNKWLKFARGKAVKVISHLLFHLPPKYNYKIILMIRDLKEVINSQNKMLLKDGKHTTSLQSSKLETLFIQNLIKVESWNSNNYNVEIIKVDYHDVINNAQTTAKEVSTFLSLPLNEEKMTNVVDKKLYRSKKS